MKLYKYALFLMSLSIFCLPISCQKGKDHIEIANSLVKENKLDKALAEYTKAIETNVNLSEAYYGRGIVYLGQEKQTGI